jgi:hypothetical protein
VTEVRLRFLVPAADPEYLLLDRSGDLPAVDVDVESTVMSVSATAARRLGLVPPVLDCFIDQTSDEELASVRREALIVMPAAGAEHRPVDGLRWAPVGEARPRLPLTLSGVCVDRLAELAGRRNPHPLRTAWSEPGWYERARAWIERSLADAGRAAPHDVVQYRHWGISAIMRVDAPDRGSWFKASFPPFAHEPAVTELMASAAPAVTPDVIATDHGLAWMLLDDLGATSVDPSADAPAAIDRLVALQAELADRVEDFRRVGCPERGLGGLSSRLGVALDSATVAAAGIDLPTARRSTIISMVSRAAEAIERSGMPTTVAHGDFHPGNVAAVPERGIVVFDWSDACVTTPIIDQAVWAWWFDGQVPQQHELWEQFVSAWTRHFEFDASNLDRRAADVVAAAFHAVTYVGILDHLEPHRWPENIDGVRRFVSLLDDLAT